MYVYDYWVTYPYNGQSPNIQLSLCSSIAKHENSYVFFLYFTQRCAMFIILYLCICYCVFCCCCTARMSVCLSLYFYCKQLGCCCFSLLRFTHKKQLFFFCYDLICLPAYIRSIKRCIGEFIDIENAVVLALV